MTTSDCNGEISMTFAVVDEGHVVFVQRMQHQLHADEGEDCRQTVGQVQQPFEQALDQEEQLAQAQERERGGGKHAYRLQLEQSDLKWIEQSSNGGKMWSSEPHASFWLRLEVWLLSLLPIEELL